MTDDLHPEDQELVAAINRGKMTEDEIEGFMDDLADIRDLPEVEDEDLVV